MSSKVKKKPPTHNGKNNNANMNNYNQNQVLYNVNGNYVNSTKDSNTYSTKQQAEDSKNTKNNVKRPSSAPVKGTIYFFL